MKVKVGKGSYVHIIMICFVYTESSPNSLVERVQDIYASVLESEECLERVACEVGGLVEDMGVNKSMFR